MKTASLALVALLSAFQSPAAHHPAPVVHSSTQQLVEDNLGLSLWSFARFNPAQGHLVGVTVRVEYDALFAPVVYSNCPSTCCFWFGPYVSCSLGGGYGIQPLLWEQQLPTIGTGNIPPMAGTLTIGPALLSADSPELALSSSNGFAHFIQAGTNTRNALPMLFFGNSYAPTACCWSGCSGVYGPPAYPPWFQSVQRRVFLTYRWV